MKMKNDYLWDKTGNDSEIEKLENALQVFRQRENDAPMISNNIVSFKKESPRIAFPVFRALAAAFAFAFVLSGIWFYSNSNTETVQNKNVENSTQEDVLEKQNKIEISENEKSEIEKVSKDEKFEYKFEKPLHKKQNYKVQKLIYKPKAKQQKIQKNQILKLTEEEKAAYEKLMLALSITGSKLKIVKDKVQNLDEQTAINTENNIVTRKK